MELIKNFLMEGEDDSMILAKNVTVKYGQKKYVLTDYCITWPTTQSLYAVCGTVVYHCQQ